MESIFVSSTFKDMQLERDAIRDISTPLINEIAKQYGQKVSFCDLRWGINTDELDNETSEKKVLSVCLDEIDRCHPPMIVILGDRYGFMPSPELVLDVAKRKQMQLDDYRKSVTALEIEYGALKDPQKISNTFFYFREIEGSIIEKYVDNDAEHQKKLKELKERIISLTNGRLKTYTLSFDANQVNGIKEFAQTVANDIISFSKPRWVEQAKLSPFEKERGIHWNYAKEKNNMFRAREELCERFLEKLHHGQQLLILKGETGCGKSTLASNLAFKLKDSEKDVIPVFCALTPRASSSISILRDMVEELEIVADMPHLRKKQKEECNLNFEDIDLSKWVERFNECCEQLSKIGKEFYFIIDAVDQINEIDMISNFILRNRLNGIHIIITCVSSFETQDFETETIELLNANEIREVVIGILNSHHRELSEKVISAIVNKPQSCNPLYVNLLIERLLLMNVGDYDIISNDGDNNDAIAQHQFDIIQNCANDLNGLCTEILIEGGKRINSNLVSEVLKYIAITKFGITKDALSSFLLDSWNELDFIYFVSYMSDFFILREDGKYDFSHKNIRSAILSITKDATRRHKKVFDYSSEFYDFISEDEEIYHAINASQVEYIAKTASHYLSFGEHPFEFREEKARMLKNLIINSTDVTLPLKITEYSVKHGELNTIHFIVEKFLSMYIEEMKTDMAYSVINYCKPFFTRENNMMNCLECLRFTAVEMYFYLKVNDEKNVLELKRALEDLRFEARKVNVKEKEMMDEADRLKESSERMMKEATEKNNSLLGRFLFLPLGGIGSSYMEESGIKKFKERLIEIATTLLKVVQNNTYASNVGCDLIEFPPFVDFGLYKGWLLDTGESRRSFEIRRYTYAQKMRSQIENNEIIFMEPSTTNDD